MRGARRYLPLERYGLIGDGHTAALAADDGSIDWLCVPRFDSPAVFWRLLDAEQGGYFQIQPAERYQSAQEYESSSNVLRTTFRSAQGRLALRDWMSVRIGDGRGAADRRLFRLVECSEGRVEIDVTFTPRPGFHGAAPDLRRRGESVLVSGQGWTGLLSSDVPMRVTNGGAGARFTMVQGDRHAFVFEYVPENAPCCKPDVEMVERTLQKTHEAWRRWLSACRYDGPYRAQVLRSALALRLLFYEPTGAVIAAPTTSLPELMGGERNWDYRCAWIRDASLILNALFALGFRGDGRRFFSWLVQTVPQCPGPGDLGVVYDVDGRRLQGEATLQHLDGYEGSRPVRVGNAANRQLQLDVYGDVVDCLHWCEILGLADVPTAWPWLKMLVDCVAANWQQPDHGIWEVRSEPRHFVHSKAMAWVALDRGLRLASRLGLNDEVQSWHASAEAVRQSVLAHGFDRELGTFVRAYGERAMDASNLLLPAVGFIDPRDPRMLSTVARTIAELGDGALVHRYRAVDGLPGGEGAFLPCAFWLIDALAMQGNLDEAHERFEELVSLATPLGLFAEEMDPRSKQHLGNFPQGLTHLALINTALRLAAASGNRKWEPLPSAARRDSSRG